uniref:Uncharacterized protein n=1 Tax=Arundo donax TaxID=35708 RepID=A0A0A9AZP5_ARUDO
MGAEVKLPQGRMAYKAKQNSNAGIIFSSCYSMVRDHPVHMVPC